MIWLLSEKRKMRIYVGNAADINMLTSKRENVDTAIFRQKELFVDTIIHIAVHSFGKSVQY